MSKPRGSRGSRESQSRRAGTEETGRDLNTLSHPRPPVAPQGRDKPSPQLRLTTPQSDALVPVGNCAPWFVPDVVAWDIQGVTQPLVHHRGDEPGDHQVDP